MKKSIVIIAVILFSIRFVLAQDTIYERDMYQIERYYVPEWPHVFLFDSTLKKYVADLFMEGGWDQIQAREGGWRMYSEDTLQVYGIAASMTSMMLWHPELFPDADFVGAHENSYKFLRLYEVDSDTLRQIGEDLKVHLAHTPVSYYVDLDLYRRTGTIKYPPMPMYERFFHEPVTVSGTFYIGYRHGPWCSNMDVQIGFVALYDYLTWGTEYSAAHLDYVDNTTGHVINEWYFATFNGNQEYRLLFPIIAPPDTTDVGVTDMVYRYTSVAPNPAMARVKVLSSFGLQSIEAYNESGTCVYSGKCSGMTATLDVAAWPQGLYVLHIATAAGTTVKKLVVTR